MEQILEMKECTGCSACMNICPTDSIIMKRDEEGFEYPFINMKNCIDCKLCQKICPRIATERIEKHFDNPQIYAAWSNNPKIRMESTSGGVFTEIAKTILKKNGYVCGARYTENYSVEHYIVHDENGLDLLRQSKYVQSHVGYIYRKIEELLQNEAWVLFVGAPCEVAGLIQYLRKPYETLILIDFVCRGANSPKVYERYLQYIEEKYHSKIKRIWFKNKRYGWNRFSTRVELENGRVYCKDRYTDYYMRGYLERNLFIRPCCEQCQFKGLPRKGDITLADFWGIRRYDKEMDDDKGTSLVFINSKKGESCFNETSDALIYHREKLEYAVSGNACIFESIKLSNRRKEFYRALDEKKFDKAIRPFLIREEKEKWNLLKKRLRYLFKIQ